MSQRIIKYIYALWVSFTIAYAWYFYFSNTDITAGYLPTFIIFTGISFLIPVLIQRISIKSIPYCLFISVITVSVLFNTHRFPELVIMGIARICILVFAMYLLLPLRIHMHRVLRIVLINIIVFFVCMEGLLWIISVTAHPDILKSRADIIAIMPGDFINNRVVNSMGYLGNEINVQTERDKWLFIGDSFGFGALDYDSNFIYMAQSVFDIASVNVSKPGFSPDDYYRQLIAYRYANDFDRVFIVLFTGNDISEMTGMKAMQQNNWSYKKRSLYRLIVNVRDIWNFREFASEGKSLSSTHYLDVEAERALFNTEQGSENWGRFTQTMADIAYIAEKDSINLTMILIPDAYTVDTLLQNDIMEFLNVEHMDFLYTHNRTKHILDSLKLDYTDTYDTFSIMAQNGEILYIPNNTHINASGNVYVLHALMRDISIKTIDKN